MQKHLRSVWFAAIAVCMVPSLALGDAQFALRYTAPSACPSESAFSDGVSAELGFVPWLVTSRQRVSVNIAQKGKIFVGSVTVAGRTKSFEDGTCARVVERLIATTSLLVEDAPAAPTTTSERRLARLEARPDGDVRVAFSSPKPIKIYEVADQGVGLVFAVGMSQGVAYGQLYSRQPRFLCTAPCETKLQEGTRTLLFDQESSTAVAHQDVVISGPTNIGINYTSRDAERRKYRRNGWLWIGGGVVAGTAAMLYGLSRKSGVDADGYGYSEFRSPTIGFVGGIGLPIFGAAMAGKAFKKIPKYDDVRLDIVPR